MALAAGGGHQPFVLKDCALIALATGKRAQNLRELRDQILTVDPGSLYHHFWAGLLRPRFDDPEFHNDFAAWARHGLHDGCLAERLGVVDPTEFTDLEALRQTLLDIVDERLDETAHVPWSKPDQQFHFLTSQIVIFDTRRRFDRPEDLARSWATLSVGSVFFHFIDARRRPPLGRDDFSAWLEEWGPETEALRARLAGVDPFFFTLAELRQELGRVAAAVKTRRGR